MLSKSSSSDDDLDFESDVPSMAVLVKRPVIIPESDNDSSDEDKATLANLINNKTKVVRHRKAPDTIN